MISLVLFFFLKKLLNNLSPSRSAISRLSSTNNEIKRQNLCVNFIRSIIKWLPYAVNLLNALLTKAKILLAKLMSANRRFPKLVPPAASITSILHRLRVTLAGKNTLLHRITPHRNPRKLWYKTRASLNACFLLY